jgi:hypothetical protein
MFLCQKEVAPLKNALFSGACYRNITPARNNSKTAHTHIKQYVELEKHCVISKNQVYYLTASQFAYI